MKTYTLHDVSRILNIPKSTLRYWEKEGLIRSERNQGNDYREYTTEELIEIGDIAFYRSLDIPMKALTNIYDYSIQEKYELLEHSCHQIDGQIKLLRKKQKKIRTRMESVHTLEALKANQPPNPTPYFSYIYHLHMDKEKTVREYLQNPSLLAIVFDGAHTTIQRYGLAKQTPMRDQTLLWQIHTNATYIPCYVRVIDQCICIEDIQALLDEHPKIQTMIATFLLTDKDVDYYQVWMEIIPDF